LSGPADTSETDATGCLTGYCGSNLNRFRANGWLVESFVLPVLSFAEMAVAVYQSHC